MLGVTLLSHASVLNIFDSLGASLNTTVIVDGSEAAPYQLLRVAFVLCFHNSPLLNVYKKLFMLVIHSG